MARVAPFLPLILAGLVAGAAHAQTVSQPAVPAESPALSREAMGEFLRTARVVGSRRLGRGTTNPWRLTLSDSRLTADAVFQSIHERAVNRELSDGRTELLFVDSYHYNIAAYRIAALVGLGEMMPVTVERTWNGQEGSLTWWIDNAMEEGERRRRKLAPPDLVRWNAQMFRLRVFGRLVADTDRNLGNVLIDPAWQLWMIDFTRAFRPNREIEYPQDLSRCDRNVLESLRRLTEVDVAREVGPHLERRDIAALMARRDALVAHFDRLIKERGQGQVLY
jgi:hypothetical protein